MSPGKSSTKSANRRSVGGSSCKRSRMRLISVLMGRLGKSGTSARMHEIEISCKWNMKTFLPMRGRPYRREALLSMACAPASAVISRPEFEHVDSLAAKKLASRHAAQVDRQADLLS